MRGRCGRGRRWGASEAASAAMRVMMSVSGGRPHRSRESTVMAARVSRTGVSDAVDMPSGPPYGADDAERVYAAETDGNGHPRAPRPRSTVGAFRSARAWGLPPGRCHRPAREAEAFPQPARGPGAFPHSAHSGHSEPASSRDGRGGFLCVTTSVRRVAAEAPVGPADSSADIDGGGPGQTVTAPYDYRHWPVSLLTCAAFTVMRMG